MADLPPDPDTLLSEPWTERPPRRLVPFGLGIMLVVLAGMGLRAVSASADERSRVAPVVAVRATACAASRAGSGTVVGPRLVVTAGHVVDRAASVVVDGPDGPVPGTVVAIDPEGRDLALIEVEQPLGVDDGRDGRRVDTDDGFAAFGHPYGGELATVEGRVVAVGPALAYEQAGDELIVVSAGFPPGMSGGPVLDDRGRVVGVVLGTEQASGTGIAAPIRELEDLLEQGALPAPAVCLPPDTEIVGGPAARGLGVLESTS